MSNEAVAKGIVFLIGSMRRGGAERVISLLANSYADKGYQVDILTLLDNDCGYELKQNVKIIPICNMNKTRIRQLPSWIVNIRRYIREKKPERVISFIARINIITLISCIGLNQHVLISERNDPKSDGRSGLVRLATYILYPFADSIVFQTKWAQSCFPKYIQKKSVIITNPVHVSSYSSDVKDKKIVSVGRLTEQKNHALLIQAFKKVHDKYPRYKLYIYGEGPLRVNLMEQIKELSLVDTVLLPGNVADIHERIADAEIFVLSSDYEGLSNALLEAMMMGLPCISTDCAGSNEVIVDGKDGLIVSIGSVNDLANAIKRLIVDKGLAKELGQNARLSSRTFETVEVLKKWESVIGQS